MVQTLQTMVAMMCEYSLHAQRTRDAVVGDALVTCRFQGTPTRGLCDPDKPHTAVCLKPGTELAFEKSVVSAPPGILWWRRQRHGTVAVFRKIDNAKSFGIGRGEWHTDALEFAGGEVVLLTRLMTGQRVTVLQLPAEPVHIRRIEITEDAAACHS